MSETITQAITHAIVRFDNGYEIPAVRRNGRWVHLGTGASSLSSWGVESVRPLAVIDLSDAEQVNRLGTLLREAENRDTYLYNADLVKILTRYVGPVSEPPNLGAVVEDFDGKTWVRDAGYGKRWYNPADGKRADFTEISAVCVLSYGASGIR
jgi:hypothetical protein